METSFDMLGWVTRSHSSASLKTLSYVSILLFLPPPGTVTSMTNSKVMGKAGGSLTLMKLQRLSQVTLCDFGVENLLLPLICIDTIPADCCFWFL